MAKYLNRSVDVLLRDAPYQGWKVEKDTDEDLEEPVVGYVFEGNGLELQCSLEGIVNVIFLHSAEYGGFHEGLSGVPFSLTRSQVVERFGAPSKSGEMTKDPILGECGSWDRFTAGEITVHIE